MRLVIAEKPSMGRTIAQALGLRGSGRHAIAGRDLTVSWCIGHLVETAAPEQYDPVFKHWRLDTLPLLPATFQYAANPKTQDQFEAVKALLLRDDVTEVVNATDAGREGQLIFHLLYDLVGCRKPVLRLWTSSLTDEAIREAWAAMQPDSAYRGLLDAARCRQEADWLVGINCTRAQTILAQRAGGQGTFSVGRVQTPTLAILVQRHKDITQFVAKDFWTVVALFDAQPGEGDVGVYQGKWFRTDEGKDVERFDVEDEARALADRLRGQPGQVQSVEGKTERRKPELLYDLTALQKEANRRFKWSAEHTLQVAQKLYEDRLISYPRTNSRHLTKADAQKAGRWLDALTHGAFSAFVGEIRSMGTPPLGKRFVDDGQVEDHSAIVVTEKAAEGLMGDEALLYDLVARRLLAAWYPDRVEAKTTVVTVVGGERFRTVGAVCKEPGWTRVDPPAQKKASDEPESLPPLRKGQRVDTRDVQPKAGKTTPPKPMTEADLLGAMQGAGKELDDDELRGAMKDSGLGTPATRANIIETLLQRQYVERVQERKNVTLRPTPKGVTLIDSIQVDDLTSPLLTGRWEAAMERIRRGQHDRAAFMSDIHGFVREVVARIRGSAVNVQIAGDLPRCRWCTMPVGDRGQCVACARSQAEPAADRPPPPPVTKCETCKRITRLVWSAKRQDWCLRCDPCDAWPAVPRDVGPAPAAGNCSACGKPGAVLWSPRKRQWYRVCEPCKRAAWVTT